MTFFPTRSRSPLLVLLALTAFVAALQLSGCGGGDTSNPLDNPPTVGNPPGRSGQALSFVYFQKCINPIFLKQLQAGGSTNTCAGSGCHDNTSGTGGAFRVIQSAAEVDLADAANTPDVVRTSDMFKNFYSAQGSAQIGDPQHSRLLNKPLVRGILHGGGQVFADENDADAQRIRYWISRPVPQGADEFTPTAAAMFTPADPETGTCNTQ